MSKDTFSVFFACAMGALIGALASLEIAAQFAYGKYFWALGALFGGLTAYGIVDFAEFRAGVARAYRETLDFRPDWEGWKTLGIVVAGGCSFLFTFFSFLLIVGEPATFIALVFGLMITLVFLEVFSMLADHSTYDHKFTRRAHLILFKYTNPVSAVYWMFYGAWYLLRLAPAFAKRIFIYVHSDRRTICFVDAALGAAAGYFYGSAVLGAMIGGLLGALNYEIISVRWLKLVSDKS